MVSEKLKTHTKQPHQELETLIIQKIKQFDTEVSYVDFLKTFYGYIAAIEQKLSPVVENKGIIEDYPERRKARYLLEDITALAPASHFPSLASDIPEIQSADQALGVMYVLEGSTLGGKHISHMISARLKFESDKGLSYFNGYKENTYIMWDRFKDTLNTHTDNESAEIAVIEAANQTFIKFKNWINEH